MSAWRGQSRGTGRGARDTGGGHTRALLARGPALPRPCQACLPACPWRWRAPGQAGSSTTAPGNTSCSPSLRHAHAKQHQHVGVGGWVSGCPDDLEWRGARCSAPVPLPRCSADHAMQDAPAGTYLPEAVGLLGAHAAEGAALSPSVSPQRGGLTLRLVAKYTNKRCSLARASHDLSAAKKVTRIVGRVAPCRRFLSKLTNPVSTMECQVLGD